MFLLSTGLELVMKFPGIRQAVQQRVSGVKLAKLHFYNFNDIIENFRDPSSTPPPTPIYR
jgi:hypothetical protein